MSIGGIGFGHSRSRGNNSSNSKSKNSSGSNYYGYEFCRDNTPYERNTIDTDEYDEYKAIIEREHIHKKQFDIILSNYININRILTKSCFNINDVLTDFDLADFHLNKKYSNYSLKFIVKNNNIGYKYTLFEIQYFNIKPKHKFYFDFVKYQINTDRIPDKDVIFRQVYDIYDSNEKVSEKLPKTSSYLKIGGTNDDLNEINVKIVDSDETSNLVVDWNETAFENKNNIIKEKLKEKLKELESRELLNETTNKVLDIIKTSNENFKDYKKKMNDAMCIINYFFEVETEKQKILNIYNLSGPKEIPPTDDILLKFMIDTDFEADQYKDNKDDNLIMLIDKVKKFSGKDESGNLTMNILLEFKNKFTNLTQDNAKLNEIWLSCRNLTVDLLEYDLIKNLKKDIDTFDPKVYEDKKKKGGKRKSKKVKKTKAKKNSRRRRTARKHPRK